MCLCSTRNRLKTASKTRKSGSCILTQSVCTGHQKTGPKEESGEKRKHQLQKSVFACYYTLHRRHLAVVVHFLIAPLSPISPPSFKFSPFFYPSSSFPCNFPRPLLIKYTQQFPCSTQLSGLSWLLRSETIASRFSYVQKPSRSIRMLTTVSPWPLKQDKTLFTPSR